MSLSSGAPLAPAVVDAAVSAPAPSDLLPTSSLSRAPQFDSSVDPLASPSPYVASYAWTAGEEGRTARSSSAVRAVVVNSNVVVAPTNAQAAAAAAATNPAERERIRYEQLLQSVDVSPVEMSSPDRHLYNADDPTPSPAQPSIPAVEIQPIHPLTRSPVQCSRVSHIFAASPPIQPRRDLSPPSSSFSITSSSVTAQPLPRIPYLLDDHRARQERADEIRRSDAARMEEVRRGVDAIERERVAAAAEAEVQEEKRNAVSSLPQEADEGSHVEGQRNSNFHAFSLAESSSYGASTVAVPSIAATSATASSVPAPSPADSSLLPSPSFILDSALSSRHARIVVLPTSEGILASLSDFVCAICSTLAWDAVQTQCNHVYCRTCLKAWCDRPSGNAAAGAAGGGLPDANHGRERGDHAAAVQANAMQPPSRMTICPLDRLELDPSRLKTLKQSNPLAHRIMGRIEVVCVRYHALGCTWKGEYSGAEEHLERGCQYALVNCAHCSLPVQRRHLSPHSSLCPARPLPCRFCRASFRADELETHGRERCEQAPVRCEGERAVVVVEGEQHSDAASSSSGCRAILPRHAFPAHLLTACPAYSVPCPLASVGCAERVRRPEVSAHMRECAESHVLLLASSLERESQARKRLESTMERMRDGVANWAATAYRGLAAPTPSVAVGNGSQLQQQKDALTRLLEVMQACQIPTGESRREGASSANSAVSSSSAGLSSSFVSPPLSYSPSKAEFAEADGSDISSASSIDATYLASLPAPASISLASRWPSPLLVGGGALEMRVGTRLDVRDSKGKWLASEVIAVQGSMSASAAVPSAGSHPQQILCHYLDWSSRWDEWIDLTREAGRVARAGTYSAPAAVAVAAGAGIVSSSSPVPSFPLGSSCLVFYFCPSPRSWARGRVVKVDGEQVSVRYAVEGNVYQRWFHARSDEIRRVDEHGAAAAAGVAAVGAGFAAQPSGMRNDARR